MISVQKKFGTLIPIETKQQINFIQKFVNN